MVRTFKQALKSSTDPLQLTVDRFLFNYRMTPHSTTGVSPSELMFNRKLRSRLDLLWPFNSVQARVANKQQSQKGNYTQRPRNMNAPLGSDIMVRNYSSGPKWLPGTVVQQTGPLSYKCELEDGGVVKRHSDQLHKRVTSPQSLTPPLPLESPPEVNDNVDPPMETPDPPSSPVALPCDSPKQAESPAVVPQSPAAPQPRRSSRNRKPVTRLNL